MQSQFFSMWWEYTHKCHLVQLHLPSATFFSWGTELGFKNIPIYDGYKTNLCLALLLQIFNHPEVCGTCGLHNVYGWWILVKLISGTVLTSSNFRGAHSHYYTQKSLPNCKAGAWMSHREQKCPTQCTTSAANELWTVHFLPLRLYHAPKP